MPKAKQLKPRPAAHQRAEESQSESRYFSRAVGKAIQMLELLSRSSAAMSLNDLSRETQLTKSSAFRLLQTLETLHYIRRDSNGEAILEFTVEAEDVRHLNRMVLGLRRVSGVRDVKRTQKL